MLFQIRLYCLDAKTGNHYDEHTVFMEFKSIDKLEESFNERYYNRLYKYDDVLTMVRPVGYIDTQFAIIRKGDVFPTPD